MTIPEKAIEAAAKIVFAEGVEHGWWKEPKTYEALDPIGKEEFDAVISQAIEAVLPLMGVPRLEDVARDAQDAAHRIANWLSDYGWTPRRSHIEAARNDLQKIADVLALPHTGQRGDAFELGYNTALALTATPPVAESGWQEIGTIPQSVKDQRDDGKEPEVEIAIIYRTKWAHKNDSLGNYRGWVGVPNNFNPTVWRYAPPHIAEEQTK
jgi:hypothetical protein